MSANRIPGADGRWPHTAAVFTRLRHQTRAVPTVAQVARHEAGHIVAHWTLGARVIRATARRVQKSTRWGENVLAPGQLLSSEECLIHTLAGRVEDERQGRFDPILLDDKEDESMAIGAAFHLSGGIVQRARHNILWGWNMAREILDARQDQVEAVTKALTERDLDENDLIHILGPLPSVEDFPRTLTKPIRTYLDSEQLLLCVITLLQNRPHGLALLHTEDGSLLCWYLDTQDNIRQIWKGEDHIVGCLGGAA